MKGPLHPYVLGGGASGALLAAALAAFLSVTTLVSQPSIHPAETPDVAEPPSPAVTIDWPRQGRDLGQRDGVRAVVAFLPSSPFDFLGGSVALGAERGSAQRRGDRRQRGADRRGRDRAGSEIRAQGSASVRAAGPSASQAPPSAPRDGDGAPSGGGRASGDAEGPAAAAGQPGDAAVPPGHAKNDSPGQARKTAPPRGQAKKTAVPPGQAKQAGSTPPGQAKKP